jgi:long-chain fatty acid transport protein
MNADQTAHAFAGGVSEASDPYTAYGNPAGMAFLSGPQIQFNLNGILPSVDFAGANTISSPVSGSASNVVQAAATGGLAVTAPINDKFSIGLAVATPFGQRVAYPANWVGTYQSLVSSITDVSVSLAASIKVTDNLSVGFGPVIDLFEARLTQGLNMYGVLAQNMPVANAAYLNAAGTTTGDMHGTDTGIGGNIGVMYRLDPHTNIGLDYRSKIEHSINGTQTITPSAAISTASPVLAAGISSLSSNASTHVTLPDSLTIGVTHEFSDKLRVMAEAQWTGWSVLKSIVVNTGSATTSSTLNENWHDTYYAGVGADYRLTEQFTLKGGLGFDQSPVTLSNRTTRIPDANRTIVSIGFGYDITKSIRAEFGYAHLFAGSNGINNASSLAKGTGTITGTYKDADDSLGLSLTIKL